MPLVLETAAGDALRRTIRDVRRRWRLRVLLRGAAIVLGVGLLALAASALALEHFRYSPWAIATFRVFAWTTLLALVARFLVVPLFSRVSDEQVALYVEEHDPGLDAAFVSAVEAEPRAAAQRPEVSPGLTGGLVRDVVRRAQRLEYARLVEKRRIGRLSSVLAGVAGAGMVATLLSPAFLRQAVPYLFAPWSVRAASPYAIAVAPGNAQVARGADQVVTARLQGFDSDEVALSSRAKGGDWKRVAMTKEGDAYSSLLLAVGDNTEYFVEANGVRSDVFQIGVSDVPYVKRIDLEYHFPAYTGLTPQKVEDGGDVAAVRGTEVQLRITPTIPAAAGRLAIEGGEAVPLTVADGILTGAFKVQKDGFYKVELPGRDGALAVASPDYVIEMLADQPPTISFVKPGRDTKVTPIEEVFAEVRAEDDWGVGRVELVYSVNGGPEKTVDLHRGAARKFVSAGHTFFLEELELQLGDFVSYFARARDSSPFAQSASTDIYFLEAKPFRRDYRQAEQAGGMQGGGGERENALSAQQRQVVAATFNVVRDKTRNGNTAFAQDVAAVGLAQARVRQQVEMLLLRMNTRGVLETSSELHDTAEGLRKAVDEMKVAEKELGEKQPQQALPPEQKALAHLQRAEAAFRDVQVAFGQQGGGGGGGTNAEDLADLFALELDKLRNQYETVQRGQEQKANESVDEALQRLEELARRQQQENERIRLRSSRQSGGGGGGGSQRQLADEAEELKRQLERLTREKPSPALAETARRLQEAADAMKRSAANDRGGTPAEGTAALERLKEARRLLENTRNARLDRDLAEAQRKADELLAEQQKIAEDVRELAGSSAGSERLARTFERKDNLAGQVGELEAQLDRTARETRRENKDASRKVQEAANSIRENKLKEKIRYSKGLLRSPAGGAQQFEGQIESDIESLRRRIADAAGAANVKGEERKLAEALGQARDLVRNMESLDERLKEQRRLGATRGAAGDQNDQSGRAPGKDDSGEAREVGDEGRQGGERQGQSGREGGREAGDAGQAGSEGSQTGAEGSEGTGQRGSTGGQRSGERQGSAQGGERQVGSTEGWAEGENDGPYEPGGRPRGFRPDDPRQLQRELRERLGDAQGLARELRRAGRSAADIEDVVRRMRRLDSDYKPGQPLGIPQLMAAIVEDLKLFEYRLRREAEGDRQKLAVTGTEEVPPGYKPLVEEYFRSLARKPQEH